MRDKIARRVIAGLAVAVTLAACGTGPAGTPHGAPPTGTAIARYHWPSAPHGCRWEWSWDGRNWRAGHWQEFCRKGG